MLFTYGLRKEKMKTEPREFDLKEFVEFGKELAEITSRNVCVCGTEMAIANKKSRSLEGSVYATTYYECPKCGFKDKGSRLVSFKQQTYSVDHV